jgi:hypothetical protein
VFDDNVMPPAYYDAEQKTPFGLTPVQEGLLRAKGVEPDLTAQLRESKDTVAALRLSYMDSYPGHLHIATVFVEMHSARVEYVGFPGEGKDRDETRRFAELYYAGDSAGLARMCVSWRGAFDIHFRNGLVQEFNLIEVLHMRSCKKDVRFGLRGGGIPWSDREQPGAEWLHRFGLSHPGSFEFFYAQKSPDGEIFENRFVVFMLDELADIRYERLLYAFRKCEPMKRFFESMEGCGRIFRDRYLDDVPAFASPPRIPPEASASGQVSCIATVPQERPKNWACLLAVIAGIELVIICVVLGLDLRRARTRRARAQDMHSPAKPGGPRNC